jgi:hypothetical protein
MDHEPPHPVSAALLERAPRRRARRAAPVPPAAAPPASGEAEPYLREIRRTQVWSLQFAAALVVMAMVPALLGGWRWAALGVPPLVAAALLAAAGVRLRAKARRMRAALRAGNRARAEVVITVAAEVEDDADLLAQVHAAGAGHLSPARPWPVQEPAWEYRDLVGRRIPAEACLDPGTTTWVALRTERGMIYRYL